VILLLVAASSCDERRSSGDHFSYLVCFVYLRKILLAIPGPQLLPCYPLLSD
jgi:hypothetical protein